MDTEHTWQDRYDAMTEDERNQFIAREVGSEADELEDHDRGLGLPIRPRTEYVQQIIQRKIIPMIPDDIVA